MISLFFTALLLCTSVFASDVIDLGDSNFDVEVSDKDIMLVEFFAPW